MLYFQQRKIVNLAEDFDNESPVLVTPKKQKIEANNEKNNSSFKIWKPSSNNSLEKENQKLKNEIKLKER